MRESAVLHYAMNPVTLSPEEHQRHIDWIKDKGFTAALISDLGAHYPQNYDIFTGLSAPSGLKHAQYIEFMWENPSVSALKARLKSALQAANAPGYWFRKGKPVIGIFLVSAIPPTILDAVQSLLDKFYVIGDGNYGINAPRFDCISDYMEPQNPTWMAIKAKYGKWEPPATTDPAFPEWLSTFLNGYQRAPGRICGGLIPHYNSARNMATQHGKDLALNFSWYYNDTLGFDPPRKDAFFWGSPDNTTIGDYCAIEALMHNPDLILLKTTTEGCIVENIGGTENTGAIPPNDWTAPISYEQSIKRLLTVHTMRP
jgi:hypothetical protein